MLFIRKNWEKAANITQLPAKGFCLPFSMIQKKYKRTAQFTR
jgi:hypothetical protein